MSKKFFKRLQIRNQFGVQQVSKRKKGTWESTYKNTKFTDWERQYNDSSNGEDRDTNS